MTHRLLRLALLRFAVGAVLGFSWFTCCSVFMAAAADVLKWRCQRRVLSHTAGLRMPLYFG